MTTKQARTLLTPDWAADLWERPERWQIIRGGRGSGKTFNVGRKAVQVCAEVPNTELVILRAFRTDGQDGVLKLCHNIIRDLGIKAHKPDRGAYIRFGNGSEIKAKGATNSESLKGLDTTNYVWIEESVDISDIVLETIGPSVRLPGSKIIATYNPRYRTDPIHVMAETPDEDVRVVSVQYGDYEELRTWELDRERERQRRQLDEATWRHIWLGELRSARGAVFNGDAIRVGSPEGTKETSVRAWDLAHTHGEGDWTVGVLLSWHSNPEIYQIEDIIRGQWNPGEVEKVIVETALLDGPGVVQVLPEDPGSAGRDYAQRLKYTIQRDAGCHAQVVKQTGAKIERANPCAAAMEIGLLGATAGSWLGNLFVELASFTDNPREYEHDDQVDALSLAYKQLSRGRPLKASDIL